MSLNQNYPSKHRAAPSGSNRGAYGKYQTKRAFGRRHSSQKIAPSAPLLVPAPPRKCSHHMPRAVPSKAGCRGEWFPALALSAADADGEGTKAASYRPLMAPYFSRQTGQFIAFGDSSVRLNSNQLEHTASELTFSTYSKFACINFWFDSVRFG